MLGILFTLTFAFLAPAFGSEAAKTSPLEGHWTLDAVECRDLNDGRIRTVPASMMIDLMFAGDHVTVLRAHKRGLGSAGLTWERDLKRSLAEIERLPASPDTLRRHEDVTEHLRRLADYADGVSCTDRDFRDFRFENTTLSLGEASRISDCQNEWQRGARTLEAAVQGDELRLIGNLAGHIDSGACDAFVDPVMKFHRAP